jgi:thiol-disulfide isomerase/thioredoxin
VTIEAPPSTAPTPPGPPPGRWSRRLIGPFTLTHIVALFGALLGTALLITVLTAPITSTPTSAPQPGASFFVIGERTEGLALGQLAPELAGTHDGQPVTLFDLDGNPVSLAALRGRPVWVNFWASWCPPCQLETPVLRDVYRTHVGDGLALVAVSVQEASPDEVRHYAETYDLPYTIAFDGTSDVFHAWRGYGLPTSYFIDGEGIIQAVHYGPLSTTGAEELLTTIIPRPAVSPAGSPAPTAGGSTAA